ncbi:MAG: hypothetical protein EOM26_04575 [Alphaproteobacteria bacterium]|nr:hypothetical protein [Alphaproteobacteria bacterium]
MTETAATTLHFLPLVPYPVLAVLTAIGLVLVLAAFFRLRRGAIPRGFALTVLLLALLNPSVLTEEREPVSDIATIVVDDSASQTFGRRSERTEQALSHLKSELSGRDGLELRIAHAPADKDGEAGTALFAALDEALADVPSSRRAGAIMLTDGQIHDVPGNEAPDYGPVHGLLTGRRDDMDRRIVVTQAPAYGIVGKNVTVRYRVSDSNTGKDSAGIILRPGTGKPLMRVVPTGEEQTMELPVGNPGQNVFELETGLLPGEITDANNSATIVVNGVRDRLKVLLVSGLPYIGERTWRNILTSDPGVDLIHFTILREPQKLDATPQNELALIPFPFQELFEVKLGEFDLIIFDRYTVNQILPLHYFNNISRYVQDGGALLVASGPEYIGPESIYKTALKSVLPAAPTGEVIERAYRPKLTGIGKRHPVTESLSGESDWGEWIRILPSTVSGGDILMEGLDDQPLLVLSRSGEGRVAQLATDQVWLWSRGVDGGGPYAELIRRLAHWLMKEPELDENALDVRADGFRISLRRRQIGEDQPPVVMERPNGSLEPIKMTGRGDGWASATVNAESPGVYAFENGDLRHLVVVGGINPKELAAVVSTGEKLAPLADRTGGRILWLEDQPRPDIRMIPESEQYGGRNWIALRRNNDFTVTGVSDRAILPTWLSALAILAALAFAWWREGRPG